MKTKWMAAIALLISAAFASDANAYWYIGCPPTCCWTYEWQPVVCYRPQWQEERVPCVVEHVTYRREVTPVKTQIMVPRMFDEQVRRSYYVPVPREVERVVPRCVMVAVPVVDPCTGCAYMTYCPQWVNQRIRCIEYDYRREEQDVNVRVCRMVPQDTVIEQVRWIPEVSQVQSFTIRRTCVMVPYQTMVCVPVCR